MKIINSLAIATLALSLSSAVGFAASATENWENHCAKCHGAEGQGKAKLKTKDYTDAKSLAGISDEKLTKDIVDGIGKMKGYKEELKPDEVKELVALIHKFAKK